MRDQSSSAASVDDARLPHDGLRAAISFLIFLHLFALLVAVLSNWNPSTLSQRLRDKVPLVKPYLQLLSMDQSYVPTYALTFAMNEDTDMAVELDLKLADGSRRTVSLPAGDLWPRTRWLRDARLAATTDDLTGEAYRNMESLLPQAIAAHYVVKYGAKGGTIRCMRHYLLEIDDAAVGDPYDATRYAKVYEARIIVRGGKVQLMKMEAAAEVAPAAVKPAAAKPAAEKKGKP